MWNLITNEEQLSFDDVLIVPRFSEVLSRSHCSLDWNLGTNLFSLPVLSSNMTTITELKMATTMCRAGGLGVVHRFMSIDDQLNLTKEYEKLCPGAPVCNSIGALTSDKKRIDAFIESYPNEILCVDLAHGHSIHMKETLEYITNSSFKGYIIAGNIVTGLAASDLVKWGANMVKVGVGPGSVCTTRVKTGIGWPQLSAIGCVKEFLSKSHKNEDIGIVADGGLRNPGDIAKALAAGATTVMIGGMLAGTDCVPGWDEVSIEWAQTFLSHSGNASAQVKHDFNQHNHNAEGVSRKVIAKPEGSTIGVLSEIAEGIRSAMSYVGAHDLRSFHRKTRFIKVSNSVINENKPHFNT